MRILFDTNIVLDFLGKREPFTKNADALINLCVNGEAIGCIAAHTIPDVFYILRKQFTIDTRRSIILDLCKIVSIVGIETQILISALKNQNFSDFEDCLQYECAKKSDADYIVTRDPKGFPNSEIPVIDPVDLLRKVLPGTKTE